MEIENLVAISHKFPDRPIYVYDLDGIRSRLRLMLDLLGPSYALHYAVKANHHREVLKVFLDAGAGVDVVSGGEYEHVKALGFSPKKVVFSGVGKTRSEIERALKEGIGQINVESEPELKRVSDVAGQLNLKAKVALRVNPDVDAKTHPYISTGMRDNKFGIDFETAESLLKHSSDFPSVDIVGLSLHIGSQIRQTEPFVEAIEKALQALSSWKKYMTSPLSLDIGGGLGIDYHSGDLLKDEALLRSYIKVIREVLDPYLAEGHLQSVLLEPGRFLTARFGTLYTQVEYVKRTTGKNFLIINTGMHHLMRPMLYQAFHRIEALGFHAEPCESFDVVGPICESTDTLGHDRQLPSDLKEGDWLAIKDVGAYGAVMKSQYNLQSEPIEIAVAGGKVL